MTVSFLPTLLLSAVIAQLGAHEHGRAELSLIVEGKTAQVQLIGDLGSLVGFEREPESDAEHLAIEEAEATLRDADRVFTLGPGRAGCTLSGTAVEMPFAEHDHGNGDHHGEDGHAEHLDVTATYTLDCERPERLRSFRVDAFDAFPGIETVDIVVLSPQAQKGSTVRASDREFEF